MRALSGGRSRNFGPPLNALRAQHGEGLAQPPPPAQVPVLPAARFAVALGMVMSLASLLPGCLFYDSRWGEARVRQQRAARSLSGASAAPPARPSGLPRPAPRVSLRLRAYADANYASHVLDWQRRFATTVHGANQVLSSLGLEFQLVHTGRFESGEGSLPAALVSLVRRDRAEDGAWVVGLVGSRTLLDPSFRKLGLAQLGGQHLVMRQADDALEFDAIERLFAKLDAAERAELYRRRRDHRAQSVLVHELGHALGAPHTVDEQDLMHPIYSIRRARLGPGSTRAILTTLRLRQAAESGPSPGRSPRGRPPESGEASPSVGHPGKPLPAPPAHNAQFGPAPSSFPEVSTSKASPSEPAPSAFPPALPAEESAQFRRLRALHAAGDARQAWREGGPLFAKHPHHPALAELRCQLAMDLALAWKRVKQACSGLKGAGPW